MSVSQQITKQGIVRSDKMQKTVVVEVASRYRHPLYGKIVQRSKRYKAHDEYGKAHIGDTVEIAQSRPISRHKHWVLSRILERVSL